MMIDQEIIESDTLSESLKELIDAANGINQMSIPDNEFEDTTKIVKVRFKLSRKSVEKMFNIKTYSVYKVGLFIPLEGLILSPLTRRAMNYDGYAKLHAKFNLDCIPEDVLNSHEFRLTIPAGCNLFVPKKSEVTQWISSIHNIQFLEL